MNTLEEQSAGFTCDRQNTLPAVQLVPKAGGQFIQAEIQQ
jgi:hypothetical protein